MHLLESPRQGDSNKYTKRMYMGISMKKTRSADFCADQIDIRMTFAVITNVVIMRVHFTLNSWALAAYGFKL